MLEKRRSLGLLHARMRKVEGELFRASTAAKSYPDPAMQGTSRTLIGTSAAEVKIWVEQMATGLGYDRVVWDEMPHHRFKLGQTVVANSLAVASGRYVIVRLLAPVGDFPDTEPHPTMGCYAYWSRRKSPK